MRLRQKDLAKIIGYDKYIIPKASGEALRFHPPNLRSGIKESPLCSEGLIPDSYWHGQERPFAETASDVGGEQPPNVKKPITSTAPAVVFRSTGRSQLSQTNQTVQLSPTTV